MINPYLSGAAQATVQAAALALTMEQPETRFMGLQDLDFYTENVRRAYASMSTAS